MEVAAAFQAHSDQQLCALRMLQFHICNLASVFLLPFDGGSIYLVAFIFCSLCSKILLSLHLLHSE